MTTEQAETITQQADTIAQQTETITQQAGTIDEQAETITQHEETITQQAQTITHHEETITQQAQTIRQHEETIVEQAQTIRRLYDMGDYLLDNAKEVSNNTIKRVMCTRNRIERIRDRLCVTLDNEDIVNLPEYAQMMAFLRDDIQNWLNQTIRQYHGRV